MIYINPPCKTVYITSEHMRRRLDIICSDILTSLKVLMDLSIKLIGQLNVRIYQRNLNHIAVPIVTYMQGNCVFGTAVKVWQSDYTSKIKLDFGSPLWRMKCK